MERRIPRRQFIEILAIVSASAALSSCLPQISEDDIHPDTIHPSSTMTPFIPTATLAPRETETPYNFEEINFTNEKFTLLPSYELQKNLGHIVPAHTLYADIPLPLQEFGFGTEEQVKIFEKSGYDHSEGNPFFIIRTDLQNHIFTYFHSRQWSSPGDLSRKIDGFVYKNPDQQDKILGQQIEITTEEHGVLTGEIVNVTNHPTSFFNDLSNNGPWGVDESTGIIFARTDIFNLPNEIRDDRTENVLYLTIIGCQNETPGTITDYDAPGAEALNDAKRSFLTIKIVINPQ
jgi:hypothetical protein